MWTKFKLKIMDFFFFNPGCEIEVSVGKTVYSLPKYPALLERDLSVLPMCFARRGDCVAYVPTKDTAFIEFWKERFQCEFMDVAELKHCRREFDFFRPWGISPRMYWIAGKLWLSDDYINTPVGRWDSDIHKQLFSRATSADLFRRMADSVLYDESQWPLKSQLPRIATTRDEALEMFNDMPHGSVFKAIYGSSGRGIRILRSSNMTPNLANWIASMIKLHGAISCENLFDKVTDFSVHYDIDDGKAKFVGISTFTTSETGAYVGSRVGRQERVPGFDDVVTKRLITMQINALENSPYSKYYCGPLGVDCMVYRDGGQLKINPCVEVNCRYSMGRLAMEVGNLVGVDAVFTVFNKANRPSLPLQKPVFSDGKLVGGYLPLTPNDTQTFSAGIYCLDNPPVDDVRM